MALVRPFAFSCGGENLHHHDDLLESEIDVVDGAENDADAALEM